MSEHPHLQSTAAWAGSHAVALYCAGLLFALVSVALLWWLARRHVIPTEHSRLPRSAFLVLHLLLGFACIVGAAALFAAIADEIHAEEDMGALDEAFTRAMVRTLSPVTTQLFGGLTHLGDTITLTVLCVLVATVLVWRQRPWLALAWVTAVAGNAVLNTTLKQVFRRARPIHEQGLVLADGFSFPSGHASGAIVSYGMLAYVLVRQLPAVWHLPVVLLATSVAFTVGCSRVFLQVHYASDVVAGFASGTAWLAVCIGSAELTRYYRRTRRAPNISDASVHR